MPNIRFHIDKSKINKQGLVPIFANIAIESKNHSRKIGQVKTRYWSKAKQRGKEQLEGEPYNGYLELNKLIDDYQSKANSFFNDCLLNDIPLTGELIADFMKGKIRPKSNKADIDSIFLEYIESQATKVRENTLKKYKNTLRWLANYQEYANIKLTFRDIVTGFDDKLRQYSATVKEHSANAYFTYISTLKQFLRWAKTRNYYDGKAHKTFKAESKDVEHIALDFDELKQLYYFPYEKARLARARDIFCFGCLTGLRSGDMKILTRDHIQGKFISFKPQKSASYKTDVSVIIPIVDAAQAIIDRCCEPVKLFKEICHVSYLENLSECCMIAGINTMTEKVSVLANNMPIRVQKEKYKLITGHTSRKTFMTLSGELGVPEEIYISITGHSDGRQKTIRKYDKIGKERLLREMNKAWKILYQAPGSEDAELTENEKLMKKEIEDLKKIIAASKTDPENHRDRI
jgi:integrase